MRRPGAGLAGGDAGTYSLDVALALEAAEGIEVAVLNSKAVNRFAQILRRSKTDAADAAALAEYSRRMDFAAWQQPGCAVLELRALSRHIATLTEDHAKGWGNRLHAAQALGDDAARWPMSLEDLEASAGGDLQAHPSRLRRQAVASVGPGQGTLARKFEQLKSIKGIGRDPARCQLLGELAGLDPKMTVRQWVVAPIADSTRCIRSPEARSENHPASAAMATATCAAHSSSRPWSAPATTPT